MTEWADSSHSMPVHGVLTEALKAAIQSENPDRKGQMTGLSPSLPNFYDAANVCFSKSTKKSDKTEQCFTKAFMTKRFAINLGLDASPT